MLAKLFSKIHKPKTREISLKELSVYWMDKPVYPNEFVPGPTIESAGAVNQDSVNTAETSTVQEPERSWEHTEVNNFYISYIMSHTRIIEVAALIAIKKILTILDGPEGDCPSIVQEDEETPSQYHALTSTLRDHSLDVTREAYDILKKNDNLLLMGKILIAALGHDLGKIPGNTEEDKAIHLHAYKSARILEPIIKNLQYRESILTAVQCHHLPKAELKKMEDDTVFILRQADWEARRKELDHLVVFHKPAEQKKNLDKIKPETVSNSSATFQITLETLIQTITPFININGIGSVFSFKDAVYVQPDWLKNIIAGRAENLGDKETASYCKDPDNLEIIEFIAKKLKSKVLEYRVHFKNVKTKPIDAQYYVLNTDPFGNAEEMEIQRRANPILGTIKYVK